MWSEWSSCSVACGSGIQTSKRIEAQQPQNGGQPCTGPSTKERNCGMPIDECQTTTTIATATMTTTTVTTITLTTTVAPTPTTTMTPTRPTTSTVTTTTTTTSSTQQSSGMYYFVLYVIKICFVKPKVLWVQLERANILNKLTRIEMGLARFHDSFFLSWL